MSACCHPFCQSHTAKRKKNTKKSSQQSFDRFEWYLDFMKFVLKKTWSCWAKDRLFHVNIQEQERPSDRRLLLCLFIYFSIENYYFFIILIVPTFAWISFFPFVFVKLVGQWGLGQSSLTDAVWSVCAPTEGRTHQQNTLPLGNICSLGRWEVAITKAPGSSAFHRTQRDRHRKLRK